MNHYITLLKKTSLTVETLLAVFEKKTLLGTPVVNMGSRQDIRVNMRKAILDNYDKKMITKQLMNKLIMDCINQSLFMVTEQLVLKLPKYW